MSNVSNLIISSTMDYSSDLVCLELEKRGANYLRINRDRLPSYLVDFNFETETLSIQVENRFYTLSNEELKAIYFRAPVFIRAHKRYTLDQQLERSQWSSFIRNLVIFNKAKWINHPVSTYRAENKALQLIEAKKAGLHIPDTIIGNRISSVNDASKYVVKALDTPLFYQDDTESFTYTITLTGAELKSAHLQKAPVIIQNYLENKLDIRVTIVGQNIFAVGIYKCGRKIDGDWRTTKKEELEYVPYSLPEKIRFGLLRLMKTLDLSFGGIDLIWDGEKYYFIEVNPTGEWGWLVKKPGIRIDEEIVDLMEKNNE